MFDTPGYWKTTINYGFTYAIVGVLMLFGFYAISYQWVGSLTFSGLGFIFAYLFPILGGIALRKANGGYIQFLPVWISMVVSYAIGALASSLALIILVHAIDPGLPKLLEDVSIEKAVKMLELFDAPDEAIEQAVVAAREQTKQQFSLGNMTLFTILGIFGTGLFMMIPAVIIKKSKPYQPMGEILDDQ